MGELKRTTACLACLQDVKLPHQFHFGLLQAFRLMKGKKKKKSTIHKYISRYDKRAGCSKKKILLLCEFYDQMHVNAVALHFQHT